MPQISLLQHLSAILAGSTVAEPVSSRVAMLLHFRRSGRMVTMTSFLFLLASLFSAEHGASDHELRLHSVRITATEQECPLDWLLLEDSSGFFCPFYSTV